jgi:hypothetical protein
MNTKLIVTSRFFLTALLALGSHLAFGFAAEGHRLVALIAEEHLTTNTRKKVEELLAPATMADVSTWADEERSRDRSTSTWHYIDYNIVDGRVTEGTATHGTILDAISSQSQILRSSPDPTQRERAVKFLIHFLGDLHQPLHCADNNDAGGNRVDVVVDGRPTRLHRAWDFDVPAHLLRTRYTSVTLQQVAIAISQRFAAQAEELQKGTPEAWSRESWQVAQSVVYNFERPTSGPVELTQAYMDKAAETIEVQFAKAGYRLAATLNSILDPATQPTHDFSKAVVPSTENHRDRHPPRERRRTAPTTGSAK